jgi:hypothetical protein
MGPLMGNPMQKLESHDTGFPTISCASPGSQTQAEQKLYPRNSPWWIKSHAREATACPGKGKATLSHLHTGSSLPKLTTAMIRPTTKLKRESILQCVGNSYILKALCPNLPQQWLGLQQSWREKAFYNVLGTLTYWKLFAQTYHSND